MMERVLEAMKFEEIRPELRRICRQTKMFERTEKG